MENLEKNCLTLLNIFLSKYSMRILLNCDKNFLYLEYDNSDNETLITNFSWESIYDIFIPNDYDMTLLEHCDMAQQIILHNNSNYSEYDLYCRLAHIYNDINFLHECVSLEEIYLKMTLLGIF